MVPKKTNGLSKPVCTFLLNFSLALVFLGPPQAKAFFYDEIFLDRPVAFPDDENFTKVTRVYGPLLVKEGSYKEEATIRPWSSWWYPLWEKTLFEEEDGGKSTLDRYDEYVFKTTGENPHSDDYEETYVYDNRAAGWAGRCDAWALGSILVTAPLAPKTAAGVSFRVRDLKGLIIKTFERVEGLTYFGQRFNGQWDGIYEDVYADQFHRFIQVEMMEKKLPFIMDHDAGMEVWNVPVVKVQTKLEADAQNPNVVHVKTWLYTADPHNRDLDFVGTEIVVRTYYYDLYGERQSDGRLAVAYGRWTDSSRWDHPDYLIPFPSNRQLLKSKSLNEKIKNSHVEAILKAAN